jgi:hypothetical protein
MRSSHLRKPQVLSTSSFTGKELMVVKKQNTSIAARYQRNERNAAGLEFPYKDFYSVKTSSYT